MKIKAFVNVLCAAIYLIVGGWSAWQTVHYGTIALGHFDRMLTMDSMQNNGSVFLEEFDKSHPLLGTIAASTIRDSFKLPTAEKAQDALQSEMPHLHKLARQEAGVMERWSWILISASVIYIATLVILGRTVYSRPVVFGLIIVTLVFFVVGVTAPALVIWTIPSIPVEQGHLEFVLQHQMRSISSVISGLFTSGHWAIGFLIMLFSIVTPLAKSTLTLLATVTRSNKFKDRIVNFLHAIGKWSMADVFVAGILLALFSLQSQDFTKTISCLGLYYFIGYCLLSIIATTVLDHADPTDEPAPVPRNLDATALAGIFSVIFLILVVGGYIVYKTPSSSVPARLTAPHK